MNSREKQRRAMHASNGLVAKVRQLPTFMKVINVVLALVLALGVGQNWAYAAELIPEGVQDTFTLNSTNTQATLTAPSVDGASSYQWQIKDLNTNEFFDVAGQTESTFDVTAGLVDNALNSENVATLCVVAKDSEGNNLSTQEYYVKVDKSSNNLAEEANDAIQPSIDAQTEFANGLAENDGEAVEGENKTFKVEVKFTDARGYDLGYVITNSFEVTSAKGFDWLIRVNTDLGTCTACTDSVKDTAKFKAEPMASEGFNNGIYIQGFPGLETVEGDTITVNAIINVAQYYYTIIAKYQDLTTPTVYDEYVVTKTAELTTKFPSQTEIDYFVNGGEVTNPTTGETKYGTGWKLQDYQTRSVTKDHQPEAGDNPGPGTRGVEVTLTLDRQYGLLSFDLGDEGEPQNCPDKVYMKNGQPFSDISAWNRSSTVTLPPDPDRVPYKFIGWRYQVPGTTSYVNMPTDTWNNLKAPGVERVYEARWDLPGTVTTTRVTLAYWCEKADSNDFEYVIERYANVPIGKVGEPYILPMDGSDMQRHPENDRRIPQVRASKSDEVTLKVPNQYETVPNSKDWVKDSYTFNDLYSYSKYEEGVTIKEDGSTVVKVYLTRKTFTLTYNSSRGNTTITKKWDADIQTEFAQACQKASGEAGRTCRWESNKTGTATAYIRNMTKYNDTFTYDKTFPTTSQRPLRYYIQKLGMPSTLDKAWDKAADSTSYAANWDLLVSIPAEFNYTTSDEYIPLLGFDTPTQNVTGPPWNRGTGALGGDLSYFWYNHGVRYSNPHGLSYYYTRHKNGLYLYNFHGVNDVDPQTNKPWHYDFCVSVGDAEYDLPIGQFKFTENERAEESSGSYKTGITGITAGDTLANYTATLIAPPDDLEHYLFEGWYTEDTFDPASKVDLATWKMQDHEQNLYANWKCPERQVRFNTKDDIEHTQDETKGDAKTCLYDTLVPSEYIPIFEEPEGYHFTSWYYYLTAEDKDHDKKTWFDPETMELPWTTYDEYTNSNDENAVLTLHQEWTENKEVDYEFHFELVEGETHTEIAPYVQGTGKAGETITYDTETKPVSDYYSGYGGFVVADPTKYDMKLQFIPEEGPNPNIFTFVYHWNTDARYHVRVEYYAYDKDSETPITQIGSRESGTRDQDSGWTAVMANEFKYSYEPPLHPAAPYNEYLLLSATTITTTLTPDSEKGEHIYPWANIIEVYYAPAGTVDFTYNVKTYTDNTHQTLAPAGTSGGYVLNGATHAQTYTQTGVPVYTGTGTATAGLNPGCKFDGWYSTKIVNGEVVLGDKVDEQYVRYVQALNQWILTCPKTDSLYVDDAEYWAVFTYDNTGFDINYKVQVIDGNGNNINVAGVTLKVGDAGTPADNVKQTLANPFATISNVRIAGRVDYYPYAKWVDSSGATVSAPDTGDPFTTPKKHFEEGTISYDYYVPETYTCIFDERENDAAAISYVVKTGFADYGELSLNVTPYAYDDSAEESILPYIGNPQYGTTANPRVLGAVARVKSTSASEYKFTGWTKEGSPEVLSTSPTFIPGKVGNVYEAATYVANFERNVFTVSWDVTGQNGTIDPDTTAISVLSETVFNTDQATGKITFNEPGKTPAQYAHTPVPFPGYQYSKWVMLVDGAETEITNTTITSNITLRPKFVDYNTVYTTYKVWDDPYGDKVGDLNKGYIREDDDANNQQRKTSYRQNINSLTGLINGKEAKYVTVSAGDANGLGLDGYKFDHWSELIWNETTETWVDTPVPGSPGAANFRCPSTTVDGHTYWETGRTFYAHFTTYNVEVNIIVNPTQESSGEIDATQTLPITVETQATTYSIGTGVDGSGNTTGLFYLGNDTTTRQLLATAQGIAGQKHEFVNWTMYDKNGTTVIPLPVDSDKVITRDTTFIANFKEIGDRNYTIHYLFQKLNNEKTGVTDSYVPLSQLPTDDPGYRAQVEGHEYGDIINDTVAPNSSLIIPATDVIGFKLRSPNPYEVTEGGGTVTDNSWSILEAENNVLNVYMSRQTDFPYALQFMVELADSARDNRDKPAIDFTDRKYEPTYLQDVLWSKEPTDPGVDRHLKGIYGTIAYVYEHPWEAKDITFVYDGPVIHTGSIADGNWQATEVQHLTWHANASFEPVQEMLWNKQYIIGTTETTPGAGAVTAASADQSICYLYANRGTDYPFVLQYWQQKVDNDSYEKVTTVAGTDTQPADRVANFRGINDDHIQIAIDGELQEKFDVSKWDDVIPGSDPQMKYKELFAGFTYSGTDQENDTLLNSSYTTGEKTPMGYPICNVYFDRDTNLDYKINYYQESVGSAEARAADSSKKPTWTDATMTTDTLHNGRTGATYSLTGDVYKNKFSSQGFTWYAGSSEAEDVKSDTEITITADGLAEVNIYYTRDTNVSFAIEYYNEKVTHTADPADKYETTAWKKTSMSGVLGATVFTDADTDQPDWLTNDFRILETGFTRNPEASGTQYPSVTIGYGLVIKLYYDRNTTTKWTVEYYQQDLNTAKTDVVNTYTKKDTDINTDGRTGDLKDFTAVVTGSVNKYQFFTQDHVTIDTTGAYPGEIVVSPNYNIRINADGSSIVRIFYNRQQVPYQIEHWKQQLDEATHQTPTDNYTCNDRTTGRQGYVGTVVTLNYASFIGYKASTAKQPVPADRKLEIGNPDYTREIDGTMTTVGQLYYDFDEVNKATYNVVVNYETVAEAIDRRDHPETHVLTYGLQKSATQQAYPGQYIYVNSWKTGIQTLWPAEHFEAFNCVSWSPTGENAAISVGNTENNQIVLYLQRKTDLQVNVNLIKEQLRYAKGQGGQQYIDDDPSTEYIPLNNKIYGETIDLKTEYENYFTTQSLHFTFDKTDQLDNILTVPPTGTATGKVYYLRGKDLTYKVGYRIEDVEHAKDPTKGGFDNYNNEEWSFTITTGIEGDTITFNSPNPQRESQPFSSYVTEEGYSYWYSAPSEGRYISGATPADQMVFELYYKRATNYIYYIQAYVETLEWAKGETTDPDEQWERSSYPLETVSNQVYEDDITLETQEVKDFIAAAKASDQLKGFTYDSNSSSGITVGKDPVDQTVKIMFTRNWDNKVYIKHYGEKLDSAWVRIGQEESEWDPEYDMEHAIAAVDTITGTADNKLLTGDTYAPISDNKHTYNKVTDKDKSWYGFDYREVDPEDDSLVISGNWEENVGTCLYIRHFWEITPDPDPDPDIPEPFFPDVPDPFPVPEGGEVVIDPDPEEYIYPDPVDPFPAHGDEDVPIYYHQKNVQIYYKVNDAALGSVDPEENTYPVITGTPIGSSATNLGAATFLNWTNEAGEVVSTDANYIPEKVPVIEPENGFNAAANADPSIYGEPFVYTANFQAGTGGQTSDNVNPAIVLALISLALVGAFVFMRRSRDMNKSVNGAKHVR